MAVADLDLIAGENVLSIVKGRTGFSIGKLREALKRQHRKVGAESRAVASANGKRRLDVGSDVEIGERVAAELREKFGEIVFSDGGFWRYAGAFWELINRPELRRVVHRFDGAVYMTPSETPAIVQLSKGSVDS